MFVYVNRAPLNPNPASAGSYCQTQCNTASAVDCTVTGTFWLDLDAAAEAADPGMYLGKPLNISLSAGSVAGGYSGRPYKETLSAQLVKK
jgi:hypothetical protein